MMSFIYAGLVLLLIGSILFVWQFYKFSNWHQEGTRKIVSNTESVESIAYEKLPFLLQQYLKKVLIKNFEGTYVKYHQSGEFRMKPNQEMSKFSATQYVSIVSPMFSWLAKISINGLNFSICDRFINNQGELQARLFSSIILARDSGKDIMRGELLRYLAELPWYPMAIEKLSQIKWIELDDKKLRGSINVDGVLAHIDYEFDDEGLIKTIYSSDRGRAVGNKNIPTPWLGEFSNYQKFSNILIPKHGEVSWLLPEGKFTYFKGNIISYEVGRN